MGLLDWLNTPKIKPSTYLFTILGIVFYIFQETTFFDNLGEDWKTIIYIAIVVVAALLGVSIASLKEFNSELNDIIKNVKLSPDQKVHELTLLAIKVNTQLGLAWESYNLTDAAKPETLDNTERIEAIKAELEQLEGELEGSYSEEETTNGGT